MNSGLPKPKNDTSPSSSILLPSEDVIVEGNNDDINNDDSLPSDEGSLPSDDKLIYNNKHLCNNILSHRASALMKEVYSNYCVKGLRFYNVSCQHCKRTFVDKKKKDDTTIFKATSKCPIHACIHEKELCTYALCHDCWKSCITNDRD